MSAPLFLFPAPTDDVYMATEYLIDGYNLLFGGDAYPRRSVAALAGPQQLEKARNRLLAWIARRVDLPHLVTIVFDSPPRPYSLLQRLIQNVHGMQVHFASEYEDADALIGELCAQHPHASRLVVVSDDREVQGFARRARARFQTGDEFLTSLSGKSTSTGGSGSGSSGALGNDVSESIEEKEGDTAAERDHWLEVFGSLDRYQSGDFSMPRLPVEPPSIPDEGLPSSKLGEETESSRSRRTSKPAPPGVKRKGAISSSPPGKVASRKGSGRRPMKLPFVSADEMSIEEKPKRKSVKKKRAGGGESKKKPTERSLEDFYRDMESFRPEDEK